jgi:hypothetical protein
MPERGKDISWVRESTNGMDCVVEDHSDAYTRWRFKGRAIVVVKKLTDANLAGNKNYWFTMERSASFPAG